jgi:hypothetical protein
VTLAYLRRYLAFVRTLLSTDVEITSELGALAQDVHGVLAQHADALATGFDDRRRRAVMDDLGRAGTDYRTQVYAGFSGGRVTLGADEVAGLLDLAQRFVESGLQANRRSDGLVHSYNILELGDESASIRRLSPMLEGQVAMLSSGLLSPEESVTLLVALRASSLYRADAHSYLLYPDKDLPGFLERNRFTAQDAGGCGLVGALVAAGERSLVRRDINGDLHFAAHLRNARGVRDELDRLSRDPAWHDLVERDRDCVLDIFENVFHHAEFTGRSGTFFAFEGLGSIYWHMVSKLLLAVQETLERAVSERADPATTQALRAAYEDIRTGLGYCTGPAEYGAFPTDPYSHSPAGHGARQPGMTGQVKEEVLTRLGEVGIRVEDGRIVIRPILLRDSEWTEGATFEYRDLAGHWASVELPSGSFAVTFCQVPVVVHRSDHLAVAAHLQDGSVVSGEDGCLDPHVSESVFRREGRVRLLEVHVPIGA